MEIDLSEAHPVATVMVIAILLALTALGWYTTPGDGQLLTWREWQIQKAKRLYQREMGQLQEALNALVDYYNQNKPDPVRGQYLADQVEQTVQAQKSPALNRQRQALLDAANAVRQWSLGVATDEDVHVSLERAIEFLEQPQQ